MRISLFLLLLPQLLFSQDAASLEDYTWKQRVLISKVDTLRSVSLTQQLSLIQDEGFKERDLILLISKGEKVYDENRAPLNFELKSLRPILSRLAVDQICLVGKDGTLKLISDLPLAMDRLYHIIDAMPMRRAEMTRK